MNENEKQRTLEQRWLSGLFVDDDDNRVLVVRLCLRYTSPEAHDPIRQVRKCARWRAPPFCASLCEVARYRVRARERAFPLPNKAAAAAAQQRAAHRR